MNEIGKLLIIFLDVSCLYVFSYQRRELVNVKNEELSPLGRYGEQ